VPSPADLTNVELQQIMLALSLGCGRSKSVAKRGREQWYCFAFRVFKVEADLRGLPSPPPGGHSGDLHAPTRAL
jgi:hypothetical protein